MVHTAEGLEAQLVCIVHGENQPEVFVYPKHKSIDSIYFIGSNVLFHLDIALVKALKRDIKFHQGALKWKASEITHLRDKRNFVFWGLRVLNLPFSALFYACICSENLTLIFTGILGGYKFV